MRQTNKFLAACIFVVAGVASFFLLSSCNIVPTTAGGTGKVNLLLTDVPSDDWQEITVVLKSISLRKASDRTWVEVWTADPANPDAGRLNLVDLAGVSQFLGNATIPAGSYDYLKLVINTNPATMKIVDDNGVVIDPANIVVVDPSLKGEIKVVITPPLTVLDGQTVNLLVDFDLAHPMSIVVQGGKVIINLQVRHRAVPRNLWTIQFARNIGNVTAIQGTTGFSMKTLEGADLTFGVNANTIYFDVDNNKPGNFAGLEVGKGVLVASNMNSDGSLYARKVWYGDITKLPQFTPEGLVRRVGPNWIKILQKNTRAAGNPRWEWIPVIVYVNNATVWTFQDSIDMGTGVDMLKNIRRGFRVSVEYVDPNVFPRVAKSINVQSAHDDGAIRSVSETGFTMGGGKYFERWPFDSAPIGGPNFVNEWPYSNIPDHVFSWWFFGLPSSSSTSIQDFIDTVNQALRARLRVFAIVKLYWDKANNRWVAENVILAPEKLPEPTKITRGYTAASGSMDVATFDWENYAVPRIMTIYLDTTGDLQTVVAILRVNTTTRIITFIVPVLPGQWESLLTPSLPAVRIWVRPVKGSDGTFTWRAYTVIAIQFI